MLYRCPEWVTGRVPNGFWDVRENRVLYLDWLGTLCGFARVDDWYGIKHSHFRENYGRGLMKGHYGDSVMAVLNDYRPNHDWEPWRLSRVPRSYWDEHSHRSRYMSWLGVLLGFSSIEDWYQIKSRDFEDNYGAGLLHRFGCSLYDIVHDYQPKHNWHPWCFDSTPVGFWECLDNRQTYIRWLGKRLGFKKQENWYRLSQQDFSRNHGRGMLRRNYADSVFLACSELMPDREWLPWRFTRTPIGFWQERKNRKIYLDWLGDQLGYESLDDWSRISCRCFHDNYGGGLLQNHYSNSPLEALRDCYPRHAWNPSLFNYSQQRSRSVLKET